jgi:Protein of unknown function (DUF3019)
LRQLSSVPFTRSSAVRSEIVTWACLVGALSLSWLSPARAAAGDAVQLELSPRICTLASNDTECDTLVRASWRSAREVSLCLVIQDRPDVKRCWEKFSQGTYSIELIFADDLIFQLKDLQLQHVLASEVLRVIREAIRYRHKRRQPWNIFD